MAVDVADTIDNLRIAYLQTGIPPDDNLGLCDAVQQLVDIERTERSQRAAFTCRRLARRMMPATVEQIDEPIVNSEARVAKQLAALVELGILDCPSGPGDRIKDGCDWLPIYRLADR